MGCFEDYFINLEEAGDCIYKLTTADNTLKAFETENEDFKRGARFGMSWAYLNITSQCKKYILKEINDESEANC